ncbi:MAG: ABC transporter permease [Fimbriimonadaceae bacterium]|nr:ABC transporter permease [Fimbriimonadaceae bacterium]QYK58290.1 MAG: ABC transporter permease [Fimbriimonadaceae bacterium]
MPSSPSSRFARSVLVRLAYGLLSLLFIAFVTFMANELAPGDAAMAMVGEKASPEALQRAREQLGLDRPWPVRFVEFVGNSARGDFGRSYFGIREPVADIIARTLPMTAKVAFPAIALAALVGVFLGTVAAVYQGRFLDQAALGISTLGVTLPNFVLAPILVYVFALHLQLLPLNWEPVQRAPEFYYLILPAVVMAARPTAVLARLTRASLSETLQQEFVKLARAKGVPSFRLYVVHGLRNAILPVVTALGSSFGILLTGSFITERFFTVPGIGFTAIDAIQKRDTPVILGTVLVTGALFVVVNLVVDMLQPLIDPRIRESQV